jgi:hypothetical protein
MLMSCEVLDAFRPFWTREETPHVADLPQLTESERSGKRRPKTTAVTAWPVARSG